MIKKNTVQKNIFISTMLNSLITMALFSILFSIILYQSNRSKAIEIIKQRNYAVRYFINGYFSEINNTIGFLSEIPTVGNYLNEDASSRQGVLHMFSTYTALNKNLTYIFSGYENGDLAIENYIPPEDFDSRTRPWYLSAVAKEPLISTGLPYRDINSGEWLLATSKVLRNRDGEMTGVISCDSSIEMITEILNDRQNRNYKSSYSYVTTPDGEVILHPSKSYIKKRLTDFTDESFDFSNQEGLFHYSIEGSRKFAYYSQSEEADWVVITVVEMNEITNPIILRILVSILVTGLVAVIVGFIQSMILSNRFSRPIQELRKRVHSIVNGRWEENENFKYPDNEIGMMAGEISKLAGRELYRKSKELESANKLLKEKNDSLVKLSTIDQLTGLYNRRKMDKELDECIQISCRYKRTFSLILFDLDLFKDVNDVYGHQEGDRVLMDVADLIKKNLRPSDIACRWGGEEFLILCPETHLQEGEALGWRLCTTIENHQFEIDRKVTISGGVSEYRIDENPDALIKRADDNLYKAKREGKNRIVSV